MEATLSLTATEGVLCALLDATCRWITEANPGVEVDGTVQTFEALQKKGMPQDGLGCEARIAGGWVRDKLLHKQSHDLDVSLSTLTGYNFALFLRAYMDSETFRASPLSSELAALAERNTATMSQIGKIAANPEQSKNLETATARLLGLDLDFVNLRKEEYHGESRIPVMSFGTPLEDALRRDITVNTLFYNVHTRRVEDWTEKGLADMKVGIVRTPMDPVVTFTDDPLRILRCVRFASRFGYSIHGDIVACLRGSSPEDPQRAQSVAQELRESLMRKVSRERFGIEVDKMLSGPDPLRALQLLSELQLYTAVFLPPPQEDVTYIDEEGQTVSRSIFDESTALATASLLQDILHHGGRFAVSERLPESLVDAVWNDKDALRLLWFTVALLPLYGIQSPEKKKMVWPGARVIQSGLKLGSKNTKDPVECIYHAAELLTRPDLERFPGKDEGLFTRKSSIGLLLRNANIINPRLGVTLPTTLLYSFLSDLIPCWNDNGHGLELDEEAAQAIVREYAAFWDLVETERLDQAALERPILDGNQIAETLACDRSLIHRIQPFVVAYQLDHAEPSDPAGRAAACAAYLKDEWSAGHIVPVSERRAPGAEKKKRQKQ